MVFCVELASPNYFSRNNCEIKGLLLKSVNDDAKNVIDSYLHPKSEESSNFLIDEKGGIYRLVAEEKAGISHGSSFWRGIENFNLHSISITITNRHPNEISKEQKNALFELTKEMIAKYKIPMQNIVSACDASFVMNSDFGFPWQEMAKNGIGLWCDNDKDESSDGNLMEILDEIGYKITVQNYRMAILAFQKHFLPNYTLGEEDKKTIKRANCIKRLYTNKNY